MAHEFQITPPDLLTFTAGPEATAGRLVTRAQGGAKEMAGFLLSVAAGRLEEEHDDPLAVRWALNDAESLSVTVAAYNTARQPDPDAPISLSGAAQIGQFVREGDTIKLSYQQRGGPGRSPSLVGLTFQERETTDGRTVWLPTKVWGHGNNGEAILLDAIDTDQESYDPPHFEDNGTEIFAAPLPTAALALHVGVVAMRKPTTATGVPKFAIDITSGYLPTE